MSKASLALVLSSISILFSPIARAQSARMSDAEIFNRCYLKMMKSIVPRDSKTLGYALMNDVIAKKIKGPAACMILFNQAQFDDNGVLRKAKSSQYPALSADEDKALIGTFHDFHNSWFAKKALLYDQNPSTQISRDNDEPALFLTRALFGEKNNGAIEPLSSFFTSNVTLKGERVTPDGGATSAWNSKAFNVTNESFFSNQHPGQFVMSYGIGNKLTDYHSIVFNDSQLVHSGRLVGVEEVAPLNVPSLPINVPAITNATQKKDLNDTITAYRTSNINIYENLGGGVIGSQIFIMKNTNLTLGQMAPGADNDPDTLISRRMSARIFEDLLCHQLPTLHEEDVVGDVIQNSPHGFRLATSCMACHSSLDPLANTYRNVISYRTANNLNPKADDPDGDAIKSMGAPINGVTKIPEKSGSALFSLQPAKGSLNYRDHLDVLHKIPVTGLADLGKKLADSDDFYRCVAKRYYQFFTGYDVTLAARNVADGTDTALAQYHRQKVYDLAAKLKKTQNLSTLVQDIVNSEGFTYREYVPPSN